MAIEIGVAQALALDAIAGGARDSVELVYVEALPYPAYNFEPTGWHLFHVRRRSNLQVGATEYIAIHSESGEFRHIGFLGE